MTQDASTPPSGEQKAPSKKEDAIAKKWGKPIKNAGWTAIPNILVYRQRSLGLTPIDLNILLHLMTYWWQDDKKPHPSKATLAQAIGVSSGTIQKRIRDMEAAGFIKRIERRRKNNRSETNEYDLSPLRDLLLPHAQEELRERKKRHAEKQKRKTTVTKPSPE